MLFAIVFLWQLPHTLAIAASIATTMCELACACFRRGRARHGVRPPDRDLDTRAPRRSVLPTRSAQRNRVFRNGVRARLGLLGIGLAHASTPSLASARRVLLATLLYLRYSRSVGARQAMTQPERLDSFELPAPPCAMVVALGVALGFTGLVTHFAVSVVGVVLALAGAVGWWRNVLPAERVEHVPISPAASIRRRDRKAP